MRLWNGGDGIASNEWIFAVGRPDQALALCAMLWPQIVRSDGYVLRGPLDVDRLRAWENTGRSRQQVETAMNAYLIDGIFPGGPAEEELKTKQTEHLLAIMADMLSAKLAHEFPHLRFTTLKLSGEDFGVSFHQA